MRRGLAGPWVCSAISPTNRRMVSVSAAGTCQISPNDSSCDPSVMSALAKSSMKVTVWGTSGSPSTCAALPASIRPNTRSPTVEASA